LLAGLRTTENQRLRIQVRKLELGPNDLLLVTAPVRVCASLKRVLDKILKLGQRGFVASPEINIGKLGEMLTVDEIAALVTTHPEKVAAALEKLEAARAAKAR